MIDGANVGYYGLRPDLGASLSYHQVGPPPPPNPPPPPLRHARARLRRAHARESLLLRPPPAFGSVARMLKGILPDPARAVAGHGRF